MLQYLWYEWGTVETEHPVYTIIKQIIGEKFWQHTHTHTHTLFEDLHPRVSASSIFTFPFVWMIERWLLQVLHCLIALIIFDLSECQYAHFCCYNLLKCTRRIILWVFYEHLTDVMRTIFSGKMCTTSWGLWKKVVTKWFVRIISICFYDYPKCRSTKFRELSIKNHCTHLIRFLD